MEMRFCYITTSSKEEARAIGRTLVEKRLAACVNILDGMESMYWWENQIESAHETVLIAKTESGRVDRLIATVKALHSYSVPCVVSLPIENGNADYLAWLKSNLS